MSVAEEADVQLNGSKDISLAVSMSELELMSTSVVMCDQDMGGLGRCRAGHNPVMGAYEGKNAVYIVREGAEGAGGRTRANCISADARGPPS